MHNPPHFFANLARLFPYISPRRRMQFLLVAAISLIGAVAEMVTLGAVVPFLAILTGSLGQARCSDLLGLCQVSPSIISLTFTVVVLVSMLVRLLMTWSSTRFAYALGIDISGEVYRRVLNQPYPFHVARNSSEILAGVSKAINLVGGVILPLMRGGVALVVVVAIFLGLLLVDVSTTLLAMGVFSILYAGSAITTRRYLHKQGRVVAQATEGEIKATQEGLGGIRDILLDGTQHIYMQRFSEVISIAGHARAANQFWGSAPRYVIEAIGTILIVALVWWVNQRQGLVSMLPVIGALVLGAQRLLPQMQAVYDAWASINASYAVIGDVLGFLELPMPDECENMDALVQPISPDVPLISMRDICFQYQTSGVKTLNNINIDIPRGSHVGIMGKTGSGKSTFVDLVMGLLEPTAGQIQIDGQVLSAANRRAWQRRIAHVPQAIYLSDASIAENIAFGVELKKIDATRVCQAARQAQLADFIEGLPDQYQTIVGERGVRLSGGQRQRIGLARAFYKQADVLILDEATSALDDATESSVMQVVNALGRNITVLTIAHRLSTLRGCHQVIEINKGSVVRMGDYQGIVMRPEHNQVD